MERSTDAHYPNPWYVGPRWSYDSSQIVCGRRIDEWPWSELWVMNADGSDGHPLVNGEQAEYGDWGNPIPEPISMAFMGAAFVGVVGWRLRRRAGRRLKRS